MSKRKLIVFDRVSADGYFASADGKLDWVVPDDEIDAQGAAGCEHADAIVFGRTTYDMFASYWPHALDEDPHGAGRKSKNIAAMAKMINAATKVVFSRTLEKVTWQGSRLVKEFDPAVIEKLKAEPGKGIMCFGSGSIVSLLTQHGLVDEYFFVVAPISLGAGKTLIQGVSKRTRLELKEAKGHESGNVVLRYARPQS